MVILSLYSICGGIILTPSIAARITRDFAARVSASLASNSFFIPAPAHSTLITVAGGEKTTWFPVWSAWVSVSIKNITGLSVTFLLAAAIRRDSNGLFQLSIITTPASVTTKL